MKCFKITGDMIHSVGKCEWVVEKRKIKCLKHNVVMVSEYNLNTIMVILGYLPKCCEHWVLDNILSIKCSDERCNNSLCKKCEYLCNGCCFEYCDECLIVCDFCNLYYCYGCSNNDWCCRNCK
jgi:hypothetical protein